MCLARRLSVCVRASFAPLGLGLFPTFPHGLRRGLHSYAASRLTFLRRFAANIFVRGLRQLSFFCHFRLPGNSY